MYDSKTALICDSSNTNGVSNTDTAFQLDSRLNGNSVDFNQLKRDLSPRIPQIIRDLLPSGKESGKNWIVCDTVTGEKKPSLVVNLEEGNFHNQAIDKTGGDIIALASYLQNKSTKDAAIWLHSTYCNGNSHLPVETDKPAKKSTGFNNPNDAINWYCDKNSYSLTLTHPYHDASGKHVISVYRVDSSKGKEYPTIYLHDDGKWQFKKPDKFKTQKLPLFNLPAIVANSGKPLIFCEGEKAADSAHTLFLDHIHTTTLGGANNTDKTDFTHVSGHDVLIYPDNDTAGKSYANKVATLCLAHGAKSVEILQLPSGKPDKWDAYDAVNEGITSADVANWSRVKFISEDNQQPFEFWYETQVNDKPYLQIDYTALYAFIYSKGYRQIYITDLYAQPAWSLVRIIDNVVSYATLSDIKRDCAKHIDEQPEFVTFSFRKHELREKFVKGVNVYVEQGKLDTLIHPERIEFVSDTADCERFFFANGILEVKRDSITLKPYSELLNSHDSSECYIWDKQILTRDYTPVDYVDSLELSEFNQFIQDICTVKDTNEFDNKRYRAVMWHIGYMLHKFQYLGSNRAVILTEANLDLDKATGRTGKGLLMQATAKLRNLTIIDGKGFKHDDKFCWQRVDLATDIVFIDDIRFFIFEFLFSVLTEGMTVERKNQHAFFIPPEKTPKFVLSTNKAIPDTSGSAKARMTEMELLCHYSDEYTPVDKFGHRLFANWSLEQWQLFDNFMMSCVQHYLQTQYECAYALKTPDYGSDTIELKKLLMSTSDTFVDFMTSTLENSLKDNTDFEVKAGDFYAEFLEYASLDKKDVSDKKFNKYLKEYCVFSGFTLDSDVRNNATTNNKSARYYVIKRS